MDTVFLIGVFVRWALSGFKGRMDDYDYGQDLKNFVVGLLTIFIILGLGFAYVLIFEDY